MAGLVDLIQATIQLTGDVKRLDQVTSDHSKALLNHAERITRIETVMQMSKVLSPNHIKN